MGVLRWWWRVGYYGYSALATDRYPPFSLDARPEYPARLEIEYPAHLSRGLVLVKWWLLALPQYVIIAIIGGSSGLLSILVLIAGVALLFTGRYPLGIFDLVMGLNRWVYRVLAYALLFRDEYPPFRLDMGGTDGAAPPPAPAPTPPSVWPQTSARGI